MDIMLLEMVQLTVFTKNAWVILLANPCLFVQKSCFFSHQFKKKKTRKNLKNWTFSYAESPVMYVM